MYRTLLNLAVCMRDMPADRQTDGQTDALIDNKFFITKLRTPLGSV